MVSWCRRLVRRGDQEVSDRTVFIIFAIATVVFWTIDPSTIPVTIAGAVAAIYGLSLLDKDDNDNLS